MTANTTLQGRAAEPPEKQFAARVQTHSGNSQIYRQHANHGQAEEGIDQDRPAESPDDLPDDGRPERCPGGERECVAGALGRSQQVMLVLFRPCPEKKAASEGGDETAAAHKLSHSKAHKGQGDHRELAPGFGDPVALRAAFNHPGPGRRYAKPDGCADADFFCNQYQRQLKAALMRCRLRCESEKHEQNRHADSVVQALSTFRLSRNVAGTAGLVTTALPRAASVGAAWSQERRFRTGSRPGTPGCRRRSLTEWSTEAEQQQPRREPKVDPENAYVRISCIRKQDKGQGQFGQCPQQIAIDLGLEDPQPKRSEGQAETHSDDRPAQRHFLQAFGPRRCRCYAPRASIRA